MSDPIILPTISRTTSELTLFRQASTLDFLDHTHLTAVITMRFNLSSVVFLTVLATAALATPSPASPPAPQCVAKSGQCAVVGDCCAGFWCTTTLFGGNVSDFAMAYDLWSILTSAFLL
jgi:hypothetical protein